MIERAISFVSPAMRWADYIALAILALAVGLLWFGGGVDAEQFLNSDTLYPELIQHFDPLRFRPPPSNNWFPDVIVHYLVRVAGVSDPFDPFIAKMIAGIFIFALTAGLVGFYQGVLALYAYLAVQLISGFYHFDTTAHFSLPLCMLLVLMAPYGWLRTALVFLGVFSDLLLLIPLILRCFIRSANTPYGSIPSAMPAPTRRDLVAVTVAVVLNVFYSEFSEGLMILVPALLIFAVAAFVASRMRLSWWFAGGVVAALIVGSLMGLVPVRYGAAVASAILVAVFPLRSVGSAVWNWRVPAAVVLYLGAFFALLDTTGLRERAAQFSCLATELHARDIGNVATDHWTSKPLFYGALRAGVQFEISQIDFERNRPHIWMAPYEFRGRPTRWAVRNNYACGHFTTEERYCGQSLIDAAQTKEDVCGIFTLHQYANDLPSASEVAPTNKLGYAVKHLQYYIDVFVDRFL